MLTLKWLPDSKECTNNNNNNNKKIEENNLTLYHPSHTQLK